ncbi:MAG: PAS domain-containing protein [Gammaproteobacteria bacterium]|nr:PAS domain-containing protein [Gammaproteobacteria bacterium]MDD2929120.1 ATP-binding protein [Sideroxydans sp.]
MRDAATPEVSLFAAWRPPASLSPDSLWRSLSLFNLYRLILGGVLVFTSALFGASLSFAQHEQEVFFWASSAYTLLVLVSVLAVVSRKPQPGWQIAFQMCVDIASISTLSYFGGGVQSNLPMLMLVSLAFAGMVSHGRITLLYAALASIALLLSHAYAVLTRDASEALFFQTGILSTSYFAVAWLAHALSEYALDSERLAARRGVDLSSMAEANRLMIQGMPDGMLVVDERGHVRQSNPGAGRLLGYTFPAEQQVALGECSTLLEAMYAAWRQNRELDCEELQLPRTNRMVRVRFLEIGGDSFWGAVIVLEDMQRIQEQAQQVKLAALGRLTANIAHEVRNPLSAISYATELMQESSRDPAQARLLQIILDNTSRLNRIVQDVMQINRRDRTQMERIELSVALPVFVDSLAQVEQVPREVFELAIPAGSVAHFDRGHFEQVLWNLCRNALRYSRKQAGSVRLRSLTDAQGRQMLEVEDDGPGVADAEVQNLFEPFYTTDSRGTGLGLYIARELCEANDAVIGYRRSVHGGACFTIFFGSADDA